MAIPHDECSFPWEFWPDFQSIPTPEWPEELIKIEHVEYETNPIASYCKRPVEMIDTIVLHHSETPTTWTPQEINDNHLGRSSKDDPWYMIAYTYVINSPYTPGNLPNPKASVGRPIDIVGAHAGSEAYVPPTQLQKKLWDEGKVTCGKNGEEFKVDPELMRNGKIKANVTTLGIVVIGNYAPFSKANPGGFNPKRPRYPSADTLDMIARMSCQLQKKYPNIKKFGWHSQYKPTLCPGTIEKYVSNIKNLTKRYGCQFE